MVAPHVLVAPDKFKGSLTAGAVAAALADGLTAGNPDLRVTQVPVADGGDGTVAAAIAGGWAPVEVATTGPTGAPISTVYAVRGQQAVVELASAVGLTALPGGVPDPLGATTFGLGTVIAHALDNGIREITVSLGGSASTDGGAGILQALGARILDADGHELGAGGGALIHAHRIDLAGLHPAARQARYQLACDVDNPLLGPRGAAAVYGPQKGADPTDVGRLDAALARWADVVRAATGREVADVPGAGAAGGTAFGLIAILGAHTRPGIEIVLELVDFTAKLAGVDLVITGEGSLDEQTLHGKTPVGVARAARWAGIPVIAVAGRNLLNTDQLRAAGISACYALTDIEPDTAACIANAAELLRQLGRRIAVAPWPAPSAAYGWPADRSISAGSSAGG